MKVLLDLCVISELVVPEPSNRVRKRLAGLRNQDKFISVLTLGMINFTARLASGRNKKNVEAFLLRLEQDFGNRTLDVDTETARIWGETMAAARKVGKSIPATDGLIAATAIRHGLHLMTGNVADYAETGVLTINPWEDA